MDSISELDSLIDTVKRQGKTAICITEHGNLYSSVKAYKLCKEKNIKYIMGVEAYICDNVEVKDKGSKYHHLIIIAKNEVGRQNLIQLVSKSCRYKYYGKPRIDFQMLKNYCDGLIVCSACMAGEIQRQLIDDYEGSKAVALKYKEVFNDDYYLEYQSHFDSRQQILNSLIVKLANEIGVKHIVTTDAHYINREDQQYHSIFVGIGQSREVGETYNDCYIQSETDVLKICKSTTHEQNMLSLQNTDEIASKCNVEIPLSAPIMPHETPVPQEYKSELDYIKGLCVKGWKDRRINSHTKDQINQYKQRLMYELSTIKKMGFEGYYLLVWSYANSVSRRGIARGSGGGSLVAYLMNIVDTDPVKHGLYFERFIDVGALELLEQGKITKSQLKIPDFDLDFGKEDRGKVLDFVIQQYGSEKVASLGSFQYIWAKGAIKDIGKVLGISFEETNKMTANLNNETIQEALDLGLLDDYKNKYPKLFIYASKLAGLPKSFSAHPCGKLICNKSVQFYNAIDVNDDGDVILQGDMHDAEDLGLIKADFLGLRTVDIIYDVLDMIGKDYEYIAPHNINFNDKQVFECFRNGYTDGIFQFESAGMKSTLKNIECSSLSDLTVANALFRPGSMAYIDDYANRKKGIEQFEYLHDDLKPILSNSFGIIVFQEQLIEIGKLACLSNPDELRQATAKKKPELLNKIKPELFNGLLNRGWNQEQIDKLWETMLDFARYSFNKSHALAYAMIAYICMYLRVHHPKEFMCAWINNYHGKTENMSICMREAQRIGVKIHFSNFNFCSGKTILHQDGICIGTETIKFCNLQIADELMLLRENKYNTFVELLDDIKTKTTVASNQLKILTGLNFFSEFGANKYLMGIIDTYDKFANCKVIAKNKLSELGISEDIISKYAAKSTKAQYREIDNAGLIKEMSGSIENKSLSIKEQIKFELTYLEYISYKNPNAPKGMYYVSETKFYNDKTKPYLQLYDLKTGEIIKTKITQGKRFIENPFQLGAVLNVLEFQERFKSKMVNGKWAKTDEKEKILAQWIVY